jgi:hypothetical protein
MKTLLHVGLGDFDPGTLPMDAFRLEGKRGDKERAVGLKAPWVYTEGGVIVEASIYTLGHGDRVVWVNNADGFTLTIPEGLPLLRGVRIGRIIASGAILTVETSGDELVEGFGSLVTHGPYVDSTLNNAEVTLRKVSTTEWKFVAGVISGSDGGGSWQRFPDGTELTGTGRWK